jgi:hypothetical protein
MQGLVWPITGAEFYVCETGKSMTAAKAIVRITSADRNRHFHHFVDQLKQIQ